MASANSFQFRMGAGFPGDVNRSHPANIEPNLADGSTPPNYFGDVGVRSSTGTIRAVTSGDTSEAIGFGVVVRPYPVQAASATNYGTAAYGVGSPVADTPIDLLTHGYIIVKVNSNASSIVNGSQVYVWSAAASGAHVPGQFEGTNPSGSGFTVTGAYFRGPADANGYVEIVLP